MTLLPQPIQLKTQHLIVEALTKAQESRRKRVTRMMVTKAMPKIHHGDQEMETTLEHPILIQMTMTMMTDACLSTTMVQETPSIVLSRIVAGNVS